MLKLNKFPEILYNLYLGDEIVFSGMTQIQMLDVRRQIAENKLDGYYLKIDSPCWHLFDKEYNISNVVCKISNWGAVDKWFDATYYMNNDYEEAKIGSETLSVTIRIRQAQLNESIHPKDGK